MNNLEELESEAIHIIREAYATLPKGVILFSGGKDSIVLSHIAMKAFYPLDLPLELLHIDTGYNFDETILFRNNFISKYRLKLIIGSVQHFIDKKEIIQKEEKIPDRNILQSHVLLRVLEENKIDFAIGGARRDEDKARSKERFFSHRNEFNTWDPKNQRPELWNIYNCNKDENENFRVYPLSNWTEIDIWEYIKSEKIELPSLYFSHEREVFKNEGIYLSKSKFINIDKQKYEKKKIRFRTLGDITTSGAIISNASNIDDIIFELNNANYLKEEIGMMIEKPIIHLKTEKKKDIFDE